MDKSYLEKTRQNALDALNNLLRVSGKIEDEDWLGRIKTLKSPLERRDYEEVFRIYRKTGFSSSPAEWRISEDLFRDFYATLQHLRVFIEYGFRREQVRIRDDVPEISKDLPDKVLNLLVQVAEGKKPLSKWVSWSRRNHAKLEYSVEIRFYRALLHRPSLVIPEFLSERNIPFSPVKRELREVRCEYCGSKEIIPIVYGFPSDEMLKVADKGLVILGGCDTGGDPGLWQCRVCKKESGKYDSEFYVPEEYFSRLERMFENGDLGS